MAQRNDVIRPQLPCDKDHFEELPAPNLAPRQVVCLNWSARGKSIQEISDLEKLSFDTVASHLANARRILKSKTIAHAVCVAKRLQLI